MEIINVSYPIKEGNYNPVVLAIGYFDGVHLGHQQVIKKACQRAKENNYDCGIMTFSPHPKELMNDEIIDQLTPIESKLELFNNLGVDISYIVDFTKEFARISPKEFIYDFLLNLNVKGVVVGFDFTFGYKGLGNPDDLIKENFNRFTVDIIDPFYFEGEKVSSTRIREKLLSGKIKDIYPLLGRNYSFKGKVIHGDKRGRTLGFPTANVEPLHKYIDLRKGVYAVKVKYKNNHFTGVMNIGYKPTFYNNNSSCTYEIYILDFSNDIYNEILEIEVIDYIREEQKFDNISDLINQIEQDIIKARSIMINI